MVNLVHTVNKDKMTFVPSHTNVSSIQSIQSQFTDAVILQNELALQDSL